MQIILEESFVKRIDFFLPKRNIQLISGSNFIAWHKNSLKDPLLSELASLILTLSFSLLKSNVCLKITGQNLSLSIWTIRCFDDLAVKPYSKNACSNKSVFLVLQGVVSLTFALFLSDSKKLSTSSFRNNFRRFYL